MQTDRPLLGISLVAVAVLFFAMSDVLTKHLAMIYPVPVVVAVRYLASLALLLAVLGPRLRAALWRTDRTWLVLARGGVLCLASLTMGLAFQVMPVGETIAIMYLSPIAVMLLAIPLLGERVSPFGWGLAMLGFSGVLLILRPGAGLDPVGVLFALANAGCATAFHLLSRILSRTETAIAMLFNATVVGAVVFSLAAIPTLSGTLPGPADLGLMVLLGVFATTGHFLLSVAYSTAPASLIAPVNYMHLVWAAFLGWIVFDHLPDDLSLFGMAMVTASGVALALRSHMNSRAARAARAAALPETPGS